jgi:hypothetical protein
MNHSDERRRVCSSPPSYGHHYKSNVVDRAT